MGTRKFMFRGHPKPQPCYFIVAGTVVTARPFQHKTYESAVREAIRLSRLNPNQSFTVFGAQLKFQYFKELSDAGLQGILCDQAIPDLVVNDRAIVPVDQVVKNQQKLIGELKIALDRRNAMIHSQQVKIKSLKNDTSKAESIGKSARRALVSTASFIETALQTAIVHKSTGKGGHDGDGNSWSECAGVPEWRVRQILDECRLTIEDIELPREELHEQVNHQGELHADTAKAL